MKKVRLKVNEERKYGVIKTLVEQDGNKNRAAIKLGCSRATVYRLIKAYKQGGKGAFVHGNAGRKPVHAKSDDERSAIAGLYTAKYQGASYALFGELIRENEGITASPSLVRDILMEEKIPSPFAHRNTKRRLERELRAELKDASKKAERAEIRDRIVNINEAHASRSRCKYFGEMLQMDASLHPWFGEEKATLHIAVDDATSMIVGAHFCEQETLSGYYEVFRQILNEYGIPYMFFTDRRTVFEYTRAATGKEENDSFTQFGYACKQLGVDIKTSSVPQAKGRVERMFGTLQKRLPVMFRAADISTIEQANAVLNSYIKAHNAKFALNHDDIPSVFEKQPDSGQINRTLAVVAKRIVDAGHTVSFECKLYQPVNSAGYPVHYRKGTEGLVIKTLNRKLFFSVDETLTALDEVPLREAASKRIDPDPTPMPKRRYIPAPNHPWRVASFEAFRKQQKHTEDDNTPSAA